MDIIFFDVNDERYFNYIFAYQILYKPIFANTFACLTTLRWSFEIFATSQIENLIHTIENAERYIKYEMDVYNCDRNEAFERFFKNYVRHHNLIIRVHPVSTPIQRRNPGVIQGLRHRNLCGTKIIAE
ncbi:unnamed protein product [Parnassius apollo]|uniref:(apollo) hypothetical protein n=1 Tax=Parnassius apollo TaxID=110799 RepID=A0A8S3Y9J1_PARAO|nr:unnamed protein product [Parnassius apollo]